MKRYSEARQREPGRMTFAGTELVPVRSDYHANLIRFVVLSSLVAAALLAATKRVEPTRKEFPQCFTYFFVRCFVTIGFWVAVRLAQFKQSRRE
jgi:hypothetical protein